MRFVARIIAETGELEQEMRKELFRESTANYLRAFQRALPDIDAETIHWRLTLMVGAYVHVMAGANRINPKADQAQLRRMLNEAFEQLVALFIAGIEAPAPQNRPLRRAQS
jgi:hypothetical protein